MFLMLATACSSTPEVDGRKVIPGTVKANFSDDPIQTIRYLKDASAQGNEVASSALRQLSQSIKWKQSSGDFVAIMILYNEDDSFPSQAHLQGEKTLSKEISGQDILFTKRGERVFFKVYFENCTTDKRGICNELVEFAVFGPEWNMLMYLAPDSYLEASGSTSNALRTTALEGYLGFESKDALGMYHIVANVLEADKDHLVTLVQHTKLIE
jgi:hypothetical protein